MIRGRNGLAAQVAAAGEVFKNEQRYGAEQHGRQGTVEDDDRQPGQRLRESCRPAGRQLVDAGGHYRPDGDRERQQQVLAAM